MIPIIIATLLLVLWTAGQWYFNYRTMPQSIANNPFGLPVGGNVEYADEVTLFKALENRNYM